MITREKAYKLRALIEKASIYLTDEEALTGIELFPHWTTKNYVSDDRVSYNGILYKCLQNHTALSNWTPDISTSLWVRVDNPSIEFPEWIQPVGAADAYSIDAKVSHNDKHWVSTVDNNVWEPGVYGWNEI